MDGKRLYLDSAAGKKQSADSVPQERILPIGIWGFIILSYFVIVGTSNAVNLTDGLDGLAILPSALVGIALGIFAYVVGRVDYAAYLNFPYVPGAVKSSWWEAR